MPRFSLLILSVVFFLLPSGRLHAQLLPANQPEQDACNALIICGNSFHTPYSYKFNGLKTDLTNTPCDISGMAAGEDNAVWLRLEISSPGTIVFNLTPVDRRDDYDWAILDITNGNCNNLNSNQVVRCNFNRNVPVTNNGVTGLNMSSNDLGVPANTQGCSYCKYINAQAGDVYLIMINNFGYNGNISAGFTIDFSGSTAKFNQTPPPTLKNIEKPCETGKKATIKLSKPIKCSSIAANGSDFILNSGLAGVISAKGENCNGTQGYTERIEITFTNQLPPGNYALKARVGTDNNTLLDLCDVALQLPDSLTFAVPLLNTEENITVCSKQLPFRWNNQTINSGGTGVAVAHFSSKQGCDSIVSLNLKVEDTLKATETITICPKQLPYTWHGRTINNGGNNLAKYYSISSLGCDSQTTLNIIVQYPKNQTYNIEGCWSIQFNRKLYSHTGNFKDTIISSYGCDSIYANLNLVVHPADTVSKIIDTAGCGLVVFKGNTYNQSITLRDTVKNHFDCDSIYNIVHITVYPNEYTIHNQYITQCDSVPFEGKTYYSSITLRDTFQNILGCDSAIRVTHIQPEHFQLRIVATPDSPVVGVVIKFKAFANLPVYQMLAWLPVESFPRQNALEQSLKATQTGFYTYKAVAQSENGCLDTASLTLKVDSLVPKVFIPSGFTPNGDGRNDIFRPYFVNKSGYEIVNFKIFNRWGQSVYVANRSIDASWNGKYPDGRPADLGVYYYFITVKFVDGTELNLKGDVTLIR